MIWGRKSTVEAAQEILDHLKLVDHVKALQQGQKEIVDGMAKLSERLQALEASLRAIKAETLHEATKETQSIVNSVQGGFYERITELSVKVDRLERDTTPALRNGRDPIIALSKSSTDHPQS